MNNNRICICCGEQYEYCNSCREHIRKPAWMSLYHNENCKKLFDITSDYLANDLSKDEAINKYNECDLTNIENLESSIRNVVKNLFSYDEINKMGKNDTKFCTKSTNKKIYKNNK